MKTTTFIASLTACVLAAAFSGCSKTETTSNQPPEAPSKVESIPAKVQETAGKAVTETKQAAQVVVSNVTQTASTAATAVTAPVAAASAQAQGLIDRAKSYIADKKYQDALDTLNQLKNVQLTPDQQKLVDDLKAQVQKLMSSDAAKAVGNLLNK